MNTNKRYFLRRKLFVVTMKEENYYFMFFSVFGIRVYFRNDESDITLFLSIAGQTIIDFDQQQLIAEPH